MIAIFSSEAFATSNTSRLLHRLLDLLHIQLSPAAYQMLHFLVRKSMHFVAYATLSLLMFRAVRGRVTAGVTPRWKWRWFALAALVCLATSSADEFHQFFTPSRGGNVTDVLLDMSGVMFTQLVIFVVTQTRSAARRVRQVT